MKKILGIIAGGILVASAVYAADTTFNDTTIDGDLTVTGTITYSGAIVQSLASGKILVGQTNDTALAVTPSGAATISQAGVITLGTNQVASLAKADTALQPNAVAVTNVIVGVGDITNTIVVVGGQITSWTVTP